MLNSGLLSETIDNEYGSNARKLNTENVNQFKISDCKNSVM